MSKRVIIMRQLLLHNVHKRRIKEKPHEIITVLCNGWKIILIASSFQKGSEKNENMQL